MGSGSVWGKGLGVAAALAATSCNRDNDPRICLKPKEVILSGAWEDCVHKWGYRLAVSQDPAEVVAKAVVEACQDAIDWKVNQSILSTQAEVLADIKDRAPKMALFRVVQGRAGRCTVPE